MAYSGGEEGIIVHNYWILKVDVIDFLSILFVSFQNWRID